MATTEQKEAPQSKDRGRLHDELGRVSKKEEIDNVFIVARVMYQAALGLHYQRQQQKKDG